MAREIVIEDGYGNIIGVPGAPLVITGAGDNASVGPIDSSIPASATLIGGSDGYLLRVPTVYNTNLASAEYTLGINLRGIGSTGSFELGTQGHPLFIAPATISTYQHINAPNTTLVLSNVPGTLSRVLITNFGAAGATTILYDNTGPSGAIIAKINTSAIVGELPFDIAFDIGLTIVTDSKNPGDITIIYH